MLRDSQVLQIYERLKRGEPQAVIASDFNVSVGSVSLIARGGSYKHLNLDVLPSRAPKLTESQVMEIYAACKRGENMSEIAMQNGIKYTAVSRISRGAAYKELKLQPIQNRKRAELKKTPMIDRIIALLKVNPVSGCHEYQGTRCRQGYGYISDELGKTRRAHRQIFKHFNGEIPDGLVVRHTCDNPKCCNPDHLILGTHKDNAMDSKLRGRNARGSKNWYSKLTERDVYSIKKMLKVGGKPSDIAKIFNTSKGNINKIRSGKAWAFLEA